MDSITALKISAPCTCSPGFQMLWHLDKQPGPQQNFCPVTPTTPPTHCPHWLSTLQENSISSLHPTLIGLGRQASSTLHGELLHVSAQDNQRSIFSSYWKLLQVLAAKKVSISKPIHLQPDQSSQHIKRFANEPEKDKHPTRKMDKCHELVIFTHTCTCAAHKCNNKAKQKSN